MTRPPKVEVVDAAAVEALDGRLEELRQLAQLWRAEARALRGQPVNMRDLFSFVADTVAGSIDEARAQCLDDCAAAVEALVGVAK